MGFGTAKVLLLVLHEIVDIPLLKSFLRLLHTFLSFVRVRPKIGSVKVRVQNEGSEEFPSGFFLLCFGDASRNPPQHVTTGNELAKNSHLNIFQKNLKMRTIHPRFQLLGKSRAFS